MIRFIVCNRKNTAPALSQADMHVHDFWQIDWIHEGRAELECKSVEEIRSGSIAVVAPGLRHGYRFPVPVTMSVVKFAPHFKFSIPGGFMNIALTDGMSDILGRVFDEYVSPHRHRLQLASRYMEIFLYKYMITSVTGRDTLMDEVAAYMAANREKPMTDRLLAEMHGLSVNHFIKRFRTYFGTTPADHLRSMRIEAAKEMLLFRERAMPEIARASGYADIASFSKVFKKVTGVSPSAFRSLSV
ncbi:MAG: AraC family transcriptional regulator [Spirochaetota bacterium]